jgi:tetratricopeptide (TPR) repeat protein
MNSSPPARAERDRQAAALLEDAARQLLASGNLELARESAALSLAAAPGRGTAHGVMAAVLEALGAQVEALTYWRDAARLMPDSARQRLNLAMALLSLGDWDSGLPLYESRRGLDAWPTMAAKGSFDAVREKWAGPETPLAGQRVLVVAEQGLGDVIWAARFLAPLAARCGQVTVAASPPSRALLERIEGRPSIITPPPGQREARIDLRVAMASHDLVVPMMSLPWLLGARPEPPAPPAPYVVPDPERIATARARYRAALPEARRFVGVIWMVNPRGPHAEARSVRTTLLGALAGIPGVGFVNLQDGGPGVGAAVAAVLPGIIDGLGDRAKGPPPLDDFAAAMAATDLLITVDTMGAHLAGAMGHDALVLMPAPPRFSFYWGREETTCPWYPSLRLFRRPAGAGWEPVIGWIPGALHTKS